MGMLDKARKQAREAIELLYEHTCNTFEYQNVKDPVTKVTSSKEISVLKNQPCKISFQNPRSANSTESATTVQQIVKLFISPEVVIKPGSKIVIAYNGRSESYKNSGVPAIYSSHQEIVLELFRGWS